MLINYINTCMCTGYSVHMYVKIQKAVVNVNSKVSMQHYHVD